MRITQINRIHIRQSTYTSLADAIVQICEYAPELDSEKVKSQLLSGEELSNLFSTFVLDEST